MVAWCYVSSGSLDRESKPDEPAIGAPPSFGVVRASSGKHLLPVATGMKDILEEESDELEVESLFDALTREDEPPAAPSVEADREPAAEPRSSKAWLLIVVGIVLVSGAAAAAWWWLPQQAGDLPEVSTAVVPAEPEDPPPPAKVEVVAPARALPEVAPKPEPAPEPPPAAEPEPIEPAPEAATPSGEPTEAEPEPSASTTRARPKRKRVDPRPTGTAAPAASKSEPSPPPAPPSKSKGVASVLDGGIRPMHRGGDP